MEYRRLAAKNHHTILRFIALAWILFPLTTHALVTESSLTTEQLFDYVNSSVCTILALDQSGTPASQGSGFVLRDTNLLVTNAHVLAGTSGAKVKCGDQIGDIVEVVKYSPDIDLVVVQVKNIAVPGLLLSDATEIRPGTDVYAFGSPLGLEGTISVGLASGVRREDNQEYIQMSAPVSAGSSGGPVTNAKGEVVGITVMYLRGGQNLNFAIPAWVIAQLPDVNMSMHAIVANSSPDQIQQEPENDERPENNLPGADEKARSGFRDYPFGLQCSKVRGLDTSVVAQRSRFYYVESVELYGEKVLAFTECDPQFGVYRGSYLLRNAMLWRKVKQELHKKYGRGEVHEFSENEKQGNDRQFCGIPVSAALVAKYSWQLDADLIVELFECRYFEEKESSGTVYYSSPTFIKEIERAKSDESLRDL